MHKNHKRDFEVNNRTIEHARTQNRGSQLSSDIADDLLKKERERVEQHNNELHRKHQEYLDKVAEAMLKDFE